MLLRTGMPPAENRRWPVSITGRRVGWLCLMSLSIVGGLSPQVRADEPSATSRPALWSFVKPVCPPVPVSQQSTAIHNPIDAFLNSKLAAAGLTAAPPADRRTLIRRAYFDLVGL